MVHWMLYTMSANTKDVPLGPPPSYETAQDVNAHSDPEKQDVIDSSTKNPSNLDIEDPPPYKEKESPTDTVTGFHFLFPLIMRPWKRFFSLCMRDQWNISAENFGHNLTYYQLNYTWLMVILLVIALVV